MQHHKSPPRRQLPHFLQPEWPLQQRRSPEPKKELQLLPLVSPNASPNDSRLLFPKDMVHKEKQEHMKIIESPEKTIGQFKNPFARFYNDSNSKMAVFEEASSRMRDLQKSAMKDDSSKSVVESDDWLKKNYNKRSKELLKQIISGEVMNFFPGTDSQPNFSKLLWFKPNNKNGRHLQYNSRTQKCQSLYTCEGCYKEFDVPSALGGHLSSCQLKKEHQLSLAQKAITVMEQAKGFKDHFYNSSQLEKLRPRSNIFSAFTKEIEGFPKQQSGSKAKAGSGREGGKKKLIGRRQRSRKVPVTKIKPIVCSVSRP